MTPLTRRAILVVAAAWAVTCPLRADDPPKSGPATGPGPPPVMERTTTQGAFSAKVSVDRLEITTADVLHLSLRIAAPDGYTVTPPAVAESLGDFAVLTRDERPVRLEGGKLVTEFAWTLEPFLAAEYTIPALEVTYTKIGGGETGVISTGELKVKVTSLLPADAPLETGAARTVLDADRMSRSFTLFVIGGAAVLAFAGAAATVVLLRRRTTLVPSMAEALRELARDVDAGKAPPEALCDRGAAAIRRAFARPVPGAQAMTTDVLLASVPHSGITEYQIAELRGFLRACDSIRYAGEAPDAAALRKSLDALIGIAAHLESPPAGGRGAAA